MLTPLNPERQTERLEAVRKRFLSSSDAGPTPFAVYHLYEVLKAGLSGNDIRNYFRRLPEYAEIERKLTETLGAAELEFITSRYHKPNMP